MIRCYEVAHGLLGSISLSLNLGNLTLKLLRLASHQWQSGLDFQSYPLSSTTGLSS